MVVQRHCDALFSSFSLFEEVPDRILISLYTRRLYLFIFYRTGEELIQCSHAATVHIKQTFKSISGRQSRYAYTQATFHDSFRHSTLRVECTDRPRNRTLGYDYSTRVYRPRTGAPLNHLRMVYT